MIPLLTMNTINHNLELPFAQIQEFCQRWHITEFALFGSVLRDDFRPDSDIDVLVTFDPQFQRSLSETIQMRQELETLFGREVDLIVKTAIVKSENWLRRQHILESAQVIYASRDRIPDGYCNF
ncbi:putative nucleotidyltransferase [Oscillatoria acuminata PCC 6304]|uniref:Putative nucleotidyltransferase n=2 Tax=Oscillatoria acuminata TaxID=118323 RepID=K9TI54_9CYAN|nr:putative nucleotidyltransferase [Oscillatoria acuminata PCC 6304]